MSTVTKTEECTIIIPKKGNNKWDFYQPLSSKQNALERSKQFHWLGE